MTGRKNRDDSGNASELMPVVYDELRELAAHFFRRHTPGQTLQPTALVHAAYMRLLNQKDFRCDGRTHFFNIAAQAMRQILTDHFRKRQAAKRGGDRVRVTAGKNNSPGRVRRGEEQRFA